MTNENEKTNNKEPFIQKITPSVEYVLNGLENKLYVLLELEGKEKETKVEKRKPINLAMVLDKSGSMSGDKIKYARLAAKLLVDNITPEDTVHLIAYDSDVETIFRDKSSEDKEILRKMIEKLEANTMTFMSGGLSRAAEILNESDAEGSKRIYLFSDGLANEGLTSIPEFNKFVRNINEKRINTSTFGIGQDFNEDMMQAIAENGSGNYFFINTPDDIPAMVEEALAGLLKVVCNNTHVTVRGLNGAIVTRLFTYEIMEGAKLGDIKENEKRKILVELKVDPSKLDATKEVLEVITTYNPIDNPLEVLTMKQKLVLKTTEDASLLEKENDEVLVFKTMLDQIEKENELLKLMKERKFEEATVAQEAIISAYEGVKDKASDKEEIETRIKFAQRTLSQIENAEESEMDYKASTKNIKYNQYLSQSSKKRTYRDEA